VSLIKYLLSLIYDSKKEEYLKDFTVLDFFSGSATTAQAVIELNSYDNGQRKYILVQQPEEFEQDSTAFKHGYKTICDLGIERIKKVSEQVKLSNPNIDTGCKIYKIF
jgi:adenine-specific DNA-methyltransferase